MIKQPFQVVVPDYQYWKQNIKCQTACPVHTDSRGYVRAIAEGDYEKAYWIARNPNPLASICGRICAAPCELSCRRGSIDHAVSIRALKRFVTEKYGVESFGDDHEKFAEELKKRLSPGNASIIGVAVKLSKPISIIGAGPAGLACAHELALMGYKPVIYEMEKIAGGMCATGIPPYRLPRELLAAEIDAIRALGVEIRLGVQIGKDLSIEKLHAESAAVLIAVGARNGRLLPLEGAKGHGVSGGVEFLREIFTGKEVQIGSRVVVLGGGNVAYDVARTSIRQVGVESVSLVCIEDSEHMLADKVEVEEGEEEGVKRFNSYGPERINLDSDGRVKSVTFKKVISIYDPEGKFNPRYDDFDKVTLEADTVFFAIGQAFDLSFLEKLNLKIERNSRGMLQLGRDGVSTSVPGLFAAGDLALGPKLVIDAVASGKTAAMAVHQYVSGRPLSLEKTEIHGALPDPTRVPQYEDWEKIPRLPVPILSVAERKIGICTAVEVGFGKTSAEEQGGRCLDCAVNTIFDGERCILCGGCADVCPEYCLRLVSLDSVRGDEKLTALYKTLYEHDPVGTDAAIIKDEDRCIRCALCAQRCPVDAITMERFGFKEIWTNGK